MKKYLVILLLMITVQANAEWKENFVEVFHKKGIDHAVTYGLREGIQPYEILKESLYFKISPENTIKALYCDGVRGKEIVEISKELGLSDKVITIGFKKSVVECSGAEAHSQYYIPRDKGKLKFASPSTL